MDPPRAACQNARVNHRPALLVRARLAPDTMEEFSAWHTATHLPHVLAIPGIARARQLKGTQDLAGTHTMLFEIADDASVESVLASTEAREARQDWERWATQVRELTLEVFASLGPIIGYHHRI